MERIIEVVPLDDYKLRVTMGNGQQGVFDVKPYLKGSAFHELKDPAYFKRVRPARYGISWPHEQDFSSDTILYDMQAVPQGGCVG